MGLGLAGEVPPQSLMNPRGRRYRVMGEEHRALGVGSESQGALTAHTKHVSCQLKPSASRKRSPASILKSQPRHFVPNIFS